jgi:uncharacterized membrane protein YgcG
MYHTITIYFYIITLSDLFNLFVHTCTFFISICNTQDFFRPKYHLSSFCPGRMYTLVLISPSCITLSVRHVFVQPRHWILSLTISQWIHSISSPFFYMPHLSTITSNISQTLVRAANFWLLYNDGSGGGWRWQRWQQQWLRKLRHWQYDGGDDDCSGGGGSGGGGDNSGSGGGGNKGSSRSGT